METRYPLNLSIEAVFREGVPSKKFQFRGQLSNSSLSYIGKCLKLLGFLFNEINAISYTVMEELDTIVEFQENTTIETLLKRLGEKTINTTMFPDCNVLPSLSVVLTQTQRALKRITYKGKPNQSDLRRIDSLLNIGEEYTVEISITTCLDFIKIEGNYSDDRIMRILQSATYSAIQQ